MSRIVIIAASVAAVIVIGGIVALGLPSAQPARQMVHRDIPVSQFASSQPPAAPLVAPAGPVAAPAAPTPAAAPVQPAH